MPPTFIRSKAFPVVVTLSALWFWKTFDEQLPAWWLPVLCLILFTIVSEAISRKSRNARKPAP